MFCVWLRKEYSIESKDFPKYKHEYPDGLTIDANLYPNNILQDFRDHFYSV